MNEEYKVMSPLLRLHMMPEASSMAEYKEELCMRILIRWNLKNMATTLVDLNRRFYPLFKKFGVKPAVVLDQLATEGRIIMTEWKSRMFLLPKAEFDLFYSEMFRENPESASSFENDMFQRSLEASQSIKKTTRG